MSRKACSVNPVQSETETIWFRAATYGWKIQNKTLGIHFVCSLVENVKFDSFNFMIRTLDVQSIRDRYWRISIREQNASAVRPPSVGAVITWLLGLAAVTASLTTRRRPNQQRRRFICLSRRHHWWAQCRVGTAVCRRVYIRLTAAWRGQYTLCGTTFSVHIAGE